MIYCYIFEKKKYRNITYKHQTQFLIIYFKELVKKLFTLACLTKSYTALRHLHIHRHVNLTFNIIALHFTPATPDTEQSNNPHTKGTDNMATMRVRDGIPSRM